MYPFKFILPDEWFNDCSLDSLCFLLDIKSLTLNCKVKPMFIPEETIGESLPKECDGRSSYAGCELEHFKALGTPVSADALSSIICSAKSIA